VGDDGRFGLRGMRERAEMMGGELTVSSAAGQGTTVRLKVKVWNGN
jgi:signal transduction histidine kinase